MIVVADTTPLISLMKIGRLKLIHDIRAVDLLQRSSGLDAGESEAIILSDSLKASLLLMDEAKGRRIARQMGINLMGTVGILTAAYKEEYLTREEILSCVEILKTTGRHISNQLYEQLIQKIGE